MKKRRMSGPGVFLSRGLLAVLLVLCFLPIMIMLNMSVKQHVMIANDFWGLPRSFYWTNYVKAWKFILRPIMNSILVCGISLVLILIVVSLSGFAFGKMDFKGRRVLYMLVLAVMMIPYTLQIIPTYNIVSGMHLLNTYWALIIPYVSGQQIFGIILAESFYRELPVDMFEAARIDGAGEGYSFLHIALPLSKPILATVGITSVVAMYNDYIWPTVAMTGGDEIKTFCQIVFNNAAGKGSNDMGLLAAAFVIGTVPLLITVSSCMKYYVQGMIVGAVKG